MDNANGSSLKIAVVTGGHDFEVPEFIRLFREMEGVDFYPQTLENLAADLSGVLASYDALVFYNMDAQAPNARAQQLLDAMGDRPQGLVFLHHAILAYPKWPPMREIVGVEFRSQEFSYYHDEQVHVEVADPNHPVTQGLSSWDMVDETYVMDDAGPGSHILLTTNHPKSMKTIAWTRSYKNARVFAFQSGHGKETYADPNFRTVLRRGIFWAAGKI